jgi:eukaryotic-like serine/threonine-protein kinase
MRPDGRVTADESLLAKFLGGELNADAIDALEERLDREPALQRRLGEMAQQAHESELSLLGTTRMSLFSNRAPSRELVMDGLELREVIAEGGMGVVQRGTQRSLGRTVAVKSARDPLVDRDPLIQEAMLTGYLEHPNIVPVHEIAVHDGEPVVVLKHIEGNEWRTTLPSPEQTTYHPLEWHVRVLIQVCQALRFAHSRGVIHRDIKPSNVMIGEFDEVYLMDWGLGVCLDEGSRLPTLADQRGVAGTPAYMAPEQLENRPDGVGFHTDIYQLGACLFHAATGAPPQPGKSLAEIKERMSTRTRVELPSHVPNEIAAIINRAMAVDPAARYATIAELRQALESYLDHRTSARLVARGDEAAEAMTQAHERNEATAAERAFFDAAFNFRAALDSWAGNSDARDKLHALVRARVEQLIALEAPHAAHRALAIVEETDPELHARLDEALAKADADQFRLRSYEHGDDRLFGLRTRRWLTIIFGGVWVALNLVVVWVPVTSTAPLLVGSVACLLLCLAAVIRVRRVILDVRLNRYNAGMVLIALVAQVVVVALGAATDRPLSDTLVELMLLWSVSAASAAAVVDRRIFPTSAAFMAGYVACRLDPTLLVFALPATAVVMVITSLAINVVTARAADQAESATSAPGAKRSASASSG